MFDRFWQTCKRLGKQATADIVHAVFPRQCAFCGTISEQDEGTVCTGCFADLPWIQNACPTCATPIAAQPAAGVSCGVCQDSPPPFHACVAALEYRFPVDAAIKALKFHGRLHYAPAFVEILLNVTRMLPVDVDALLPVPLHRWRHMKRGFNQASELAEPLGSKLDLAVIENVIRQTATPSQSGLDAIERRKNLASAFAVRGPITANHVVIVDDVVTTGETCRRLAKVLHATGVGKVSVLALARA